MFLLSATAGVEPASLSYQSPTHSHKYATLRVLIYTVEISNSPRLLVHFRR